MSGRVPRSQCPFPAGPPASWVVSEAVFSPACGTPSLQTLLGGRCWLIKDQAAFMPSPASGHSWHFHGEQRCSEHLPGATCSVHRVRPGGLGWFPDGTAPSLPGSESSPLDRSRPPRVGLAWSAGLGCRLARAGASHQGHWPEQSKLYITEQARLLCADGA